MLSELFNTLMNENIKSIKDEIKHFQILEYNNQTIALKMDEIILTYKDSLSVADTPSNILFNKKLQLQKLNSQMELIYPYKEELDKINGEYTHLQTMYGTIEANINNIEEYISKAKKINESNIAFKKTIREYNESKVRLISIESSLENVIAREKTLSSTRKEILHTPYGKTDLIKIDEENTSDHSRYTVNYKGNTRRAYGDTVIVPTKNELIIKEQVAPKNFGTVLHDRVDGSFTVNQLVKAVKKTKTKKPFTDVQIQYLKRILFDEELFIEEMDAETM